MAHRWTLVTVLLLVLSACASGTEEREPGVEARSTDLSYGIENEEAAAPPNTGAQPGQGRVPAPEGREDEAPATINPFLIPRPEGNGGGGGGGGRCPTPAPRENPDKEASFEVEGLPEAGFYLWSVDGGELVDRGGGNFFRSSFRDFVRREVQGVKGSEGDFQYSVVEEELTAQNPDRITTTYQIDSSGVSLIRIERVSSDGDPTVFSPTPAITYLPTPVSVGQEESFSSQGVDVTSSAQPQILEHSGFVKGKQTINACGEEVRAWIVEAQQTYRIGAEEVQRDFTYGIATQRGALFVYEEVRTCEGRDAEGNCQPVETTEGGEERYRIDYVAHVGQLEPDDG